jgi:hypothetical protein
MDDFTKIFLVLFYLLLILSIWYVIKRKINNKSISFPIKFSSSPKTFGTLLRDIPQVNDLAKRYSVTKPHRLLASQNVIIPTSFDGRIVWKDYITPVMDQGVCGNCYSMSSCSALADRFAIMSLGKIKFIPSPYEITTCSHHFTDIQAQWGNTGALMLMDDYIHGVKVDPTQQVQSSSCEGASLFTALDILYTDGVPELSCFPASGRVGDTSYDIPNTSEDDPQKLPYCLLLETMDFDTCIDQKTAMKKYRAKTGYSVGDPEKDTLDELEQSIKAEIYKNGPLATGFQVFSDFMSPYDGTKVYTHSVANSTSQGGHAVKIVGWGEDGVDEKGNTNVPYWIIQNSWGTDWGLDGFFKIKRKIPECQLEQNAMAMLPDFPGFEVTDTSIVPVETKQDIATDAFQGHYLDPTTGYFLSGLDKIKNCKLEGNATPYLDLSMPLPNYATFNAGEIASYLSKNPLPEDKPLVPVVYCGMNSSDSPTGSGGGSTPITPTPVTPSPTPPQPITQQSSFTINKNLVLDTTFLLLAITGSLSIWFGLRDTADSVIGKNLLEGYIPGSNL